MTQIYDSKPPEEESTLATTPEGKLLVSSLDLALRTVLTPTEFITFFPIDTVIMQLGHTPKLRASILTACVGMPMNTALNLSVQTTSKVLEAALEAGDTTPEKILEVFVPEACVLYLPWPDIAKFLLANTAWWNAQEGDGETWIHATTYTIDVITTALKLECLTTDQLRDWLGVEALTKHLLEYENNEPEEKSNKGELLRQVTATAILYGAEGKPFTSEDLFTMVSPDTLHELMLVAELHQKVLLRLAESCSWGSNTARQTTSTSATVTTVTTKAAVKSDKPPVQKKTLPPPPPDTLTEEN
ncbi:MAG: hypothetical protein ABIB04_04330 [Patescibacteria group bacterium]